MQDRRISMAEGRQFRDFSIMTAFVNSSTLRTAALTLLLLSGTGAASAASFDCDKEGLKADEKAICDNRDLNDADVKMVTTFDILTGLLAMGSRGSLQDEQSAWLTKRQSCNADLQCLRDAYLTRLKQLDAAYGTIQRPL